jgi:hypothetical protein
MDATPRNTVSSGNAAVEHATAIESLKTLDPQLLPALTKEFKSFILSGRVNIPQVVLRGAEAAGQFAISPPLSRLFPHIDLSDPDIIPENLCPTCGEETFKLGPNAWRWICQNPKCRREVANNMWPLTRGAITLALLHFLNEKRMEFERLEEEGGDPQVDPDDPDTLVFSRANRIRKLMNGRTFSFLLQGKAAMNVRGNGGCIEMIYSDGEIFPGCWYKHGQNDMIIRDTSSLMSLPLSLAPGKVYSPSPYDRMSSPAKMPQIGLFSDLDDIYRNIAWDQLLPHLARTDWLRGVAKQQAPPELGQPKVKGGDEKNTFLKDYGQALITSAHRTHFFLPQLAKRMGVGLEFNIDERIANDAKATANFTGMPVALIAEDLKRMYREMSAMTEDRAQSFVKDFESASSGAARLRLFRPDRKLLERVEQNLELRFLLMKKIILAVSGMFGFGGEYGDDEDTYILQRGGGVGSSNVKLHANVFSPATIAREFGLSQEVVEREMKRAVKDIVGYLVDLDASHDEVSSPRETRGTRLVLQYLVPKPIIAAFLTENVERQKQSQEFIKPHWHNPVAEAAIFVERLGRAVKMMKSDDEVQRSGGELYIEKLRAKYASTIPADIFDVAREDLKEGAVTGSTFRAFMAIEELGHDRIGPEQGHTTVVTAR